MTYHNGRELVRLAEIRLRVPDPEATASFFESAVGFHRRSFADRQELSTTGDYGVGSATPDVVLLEGTGGEIERVVMEFADSVDPEEFASCLAGAGIRHDRGEAGTVEVHDPDGILVECRSRIPHVGGPLPPSPLRPRRLGHVNLQVTNAVRTAEFWEAGLGLALSERVGDLLWFLRAGSEHHNIGLRGRAAGAGVHHVAFEVAGWETHRVICDHIADLGHQVEYGPGRHGPGRNLFVYVRDPSSGLRLELYADMAHIDDDAAYEAPIWDTADRARTMNRWGPGPPDSFLA